MRAETSDVAFRLLLALGELWEGLQRANIDATARGLHLTKEYLGGYTRYSVGPSSHPRMVVEWNESSRHLRVLRCMDWPGFDQMVSATVAHVRTRAREIGIADVVDKAFLKACESPAPSKRTVLSAAMAAAQQPVIARRA